MSIKVSVEVDVLVFGEKIEAYLAFPYCIYILIKFDSWSEL